MSVLVIAPHPDDEVLGCGGTILTHRAAGRQVHIAWLTSGEHGSADLPAADLGRLREQEATHAAEVLDVDPDRLRFLRIADGGIDAGDLDQVAAVVRLLRQLTPELLYVPHPHDDSYDHEAAFRLCWRAAGLAASRTFASWGGDPHWVDTILGYEVWAPIGAPAHLQDISAVADRKVAALSCYTSQSPASKGARQASHVGPAALHLAGYRGAVSTGGYREAFAVLRLGRVIA